MMIRFPLSFLATLGGVVTRDEEEFVTELRHIPEGWLAVAGLALLAALCWAVIWMYRHEGRMGASARVRTTLGVIRCLILVLLGVILLEPVRVRILRRWVDSYTVVLLDDSSSMGLEDAYRDEGAANRLNRLFDSKVEKPLRRTSVLNRILSVDDRKFLRDLADNNRVKLYSFSDEPTLRGTIRATRERSESSQTVEGSLLGAEHIDITLEANGAATNVERAVRRAVESLGGAPVAAVVILSDGGINQGSSAEESARFARERRLPIHVVGIGDPSRPRNVRVTEILAPPNAFQQDPFSVTARLNAIGIDGETITVQLRERSATRSGESRVVETRRVRVLPGGSIEPVSFSRSQDRVGRFIYTVEVPAIEGESVADDNSKQTTVNVIDSRTRVLVIAGGPSWEYRFVSRLLERDDTFDVSCWLQSADLSAVRDGNTIIDHLPVSAEELFEYDVILIFNPQHEEFDEDWCRLVDTLVSEYGGGLLLGASRSRTPTFLRDRSLKILHNLLPVTFDPEADIVLNEIGYYQTSPSKLEIPATSFGHPILQIGGDPVSAKLTWRNLGDIYWHYPVLREKPVATVLLRHGHPRMRNSYGGHVLAAVQYVGAGRTAFLGFDSTWRWRRQNVEVFDYFWVQMVRYLAEGKLFGGTKRGMILTESEEFSLGEAVTVTARLLDQQYKPLKRDMILAQYSVDGERGDFELTARRDRPGWFEGRFVPDRTGSYRISLKMPRRSADDPMEIATELRVTRPNIEILRPQMDKAALMTLALQSDGGKYFDVDQASELPGMIPDLHEEIPIRSRPTTLWDNGIVLTLLLALMTTEWGIRKWNRLL